MAVNPMESAPIRSFADLLPVQFLDQRNLPRHPLRIQIMHGHHCQFLSRHVPYSAGHVQCVLAPYLLEVTLWRTPRTYCSDRFSANPFSAAVLITESALPKRRRQRYYFRIAMHTELVTGPILAHRVNPPNHRPTRWPLPTSSIRIIHATSSTMDRYLGPDLRDHLRTHLDRAGPAGLPFNRG